MERIEDKPVYDPSGSKESIEDKPVDDPFGISRKSIEERLNALEECCKEICCKENENKIENKIFILKQIISKEGHEYTPYEENFILNNFDLVISNFEKLPKESSTTKIENFINGFILNWIRWNREDVEHLDENKIEKIMRFIIKLNTLFPGRYDVIDSLERTFINHPNHRPDNIKFLKKIIKKIKESNDEEPKDEKPFIKKEDGKKRRE